MRKRGTPLMVTQGEFDAVVRLLAKARRYGMSDRMIGEQVGVHATLPSKIRRGDTKKIHRDTYNKLIKLRPQRPDTNYFESRGKVGSGPYVNSTGTVRRMQALRADGFPGWFIGERLGVTYEAVSQLARSARPRVLETTRADVAELYADLAGKRPEDFGITQHTIGRCTTLARRQGFVPRSCWDPATIDDPAAEPEWTGYCGTPLGRMVHARDGIPFCPRCKEAPNKIPFSGEKFKDLRESLGMSQRELEAAAGLSKGHVHHWEAGRYAPRPDVLNRVLANLDATYEDVCEET